MTTIRRTAACLSVIALVAAPLALGQNAQQGGVGTIALSPTEFVKKASQINLAEIEIGTLAERQAPRADVRQYGQLLAKHHKMLLDQLKAVAAKQSLPVSTTIDQKHQAMAAQLAKLQGENFDRQFLPQMVKGHKEAIQMFEAEAKSGQNAAIREAAQKALPILREHLKMAEQLEKTNK